VTITDTSRRERISCLSCSAIVDAVGSLYRHPAHIVDLVSPTPGAAVFGPAITIQFFPARDDYRHSADNDFAAQFYRALMGAPPQAVVVMSNGGHPDAALAGGRKLARLHYQDIAGLVTDGRLRDFDEIAGYSFTAYARGEQVRQSGDRVVPVAANVPVEVAGVGVYPGDYVYATPAGTVVVPRTDIDAVLAAAEQREARDAELVRLAATEDRETVSRSGEQLGRPPEQDEPAAWTHAAMWQRGRRRRIRAHFLGNAPRGAGAAHARAHGGPTRYRAPR